MLWRRVRQRSWFGPLALVVVISASVWLGIASFLAQEHHRLLDAARSDSANLARAFGENVLRSFDAADQMLVFARDLARHDPAGFDLPGWVSEHGLAGAGAITGISRVGPDGFVAQSNLGAPASPVYFGDRAPFRAQREAPGDSFYIGGPAADGFSGRPTVECSRRISDAAGRFDGVMLAFLDVGQLTRFYGTARIGHGMLLLAGLDGRILAEAPGRPTGAGSRLDAADAAALLGGNGEGTYESVLDGEGRRVPMLVSYRRLQDYPLVVAVGLDLDEVLAPYLQARVLLLAFGMSLTAVVTLAGALLAVLRTGQTNGQEALNVTLASISQGVVMVDARQRVRVINRRAIELLLLPGAVPRRGWRWPGWRAWIGPGWRRGAARTPPRPEPPRPEIDHELHRRVVAALPEEAGIRECEGQGGRRLEIRTHRLASGARVHTCTDITERRADEQALADARDAAEAAGRARAAFLAVMSHEIRTPMNGIVGVAELLEERELDAIGRDYVRLIRESGRHLMRIVNDVLDFSRLDAARLELEERSFDLAAAFGQVTDLLAASASAKGLALTLDLAADLPARAVGDQRRLVQVLLNLVGNGLKFTATGGVRVTVRRQAAPPGRLHLRVAVADTGIGIAPEAQARLFVEFSQVDNSISRRFGGSGLGLAISRRLVERMGGTIAVESTPGRGSTFRFDVLLGEAPETAATPGASDSPTGSPAGEGVPGPEEVRTGGLRVLLAEDNDTNRLVAIRMLECLGHVVIPVTNGAEAVARLQGGTFDLVLMDVMMPEMDGLAATRAIRALPGAAARVPVIGLSAAAMRADEEAAIAAGMDGFTTKPIGLGRLEAAISAGMARRTEASDARSG